MKYGFPLFAKSSSIVSLGKNEKIVISDIWAFWDYVVKKASNDRKTEVFLRSLLEQAKNFYIAAEASPTKSQPLLYYYSFLNFSKILINLVKKHGPGKKYMHGMKVENTGRFLHSEVVKDKQKSNVVQVAHELVSEFDPTISTDAVRLKVKDLLNHCIGVHRAYSEIYNQREVFFRLHEPKLYKNGKELIFKAELKCVANNVPSLRARGYVVTQDDNKYFYEVKNVATTYVPARRDYAVLSATIQRNGIWYYLGNSGYTMYLSDSTVGRLSQESIIYMVMFYLGSITRYHPYMFDEIFSDKDQWLMSEFLRTQPKQYLYLATARILGQSVYKAYAMF
jgi:hypothetical protein